jgi:vacuolar protein sorting-associated protein 26
MDGSPSRGETIPIRLFLGGFDLTPTFRDVNKKFSTRYYLSLVLIDEGMSSFPDHRTRQLRQHKISEANRVLPNPSADARRYFKQSEISLYRQAPDLPGPESTAPAPPADNRALAHAPAATAHA